MSVKVLSQVLEHSRAELGTRLVIMVYADFAGDETYEAYPGVARVSRLTRLSRRQVQYSLRRLEAMGELRRVGKSSYGTTIYRVCPGGADIAPGVDVPQVQSSTQGGAILDMEGAQPTAPEPTTKPPINLGPQKSRPRDLLFEEIAAQCGWNTKALTKDGRGRLNAAVKQLRDVGADPREVRVKAALFRQAYPQAQLTPQALTVHWAALVGARRIPYEVTPEVEVDVLPPEENLARMRALRRQMNGGSNGK